MTRFEDFLALHVPGRPLLMPNPWDVGSARILASLGFQALATTSSGFAATLGRGDGRVARHEVLEHAAALVAAVDVPVSADLEGGFGTDPEGVAETVTLAVAAGLAGCSVEDHARDGHEPVLPIDVATERVRAAAGAAGDRIVITARAENHLYGRDDLADTITRLQAYADAGAHVLFAPGVVDPGRLAELVAEVDRPVNVLALPGAPTVAELADLGVARVSVGGAFAYAAIDALATAGRELLGEGTYGYLTRTVAGRDVAEAAFGETSG